MRGLAHSVRNAELSNRIRGYQTVLVVSLLWFMVQFLRFVFPPLFGTFQDMYGVSNTETGALFTLLMLGYSAVQFPAGWVADRVTERSVLTAGPIFYAIAALFVFAAPTYAFITLAAVLIGLGTGPHKTVAIPYLSDVYPERTGFSLGIMDTIGQMGGMIAPIVVVTVIGSPFSWRIIFLIGACVSILLSILFFVTAQRLNTTEASGEPRTNDSDDGSEEQAEGAEKSGTPDSYVEVFYEPRVVLFLAVTMLFTFSWNGLSAFFPLYLAEQKAISPDTVGLLYSLLFVMSVSQTATGIASDTFHRLDLAVALFVVMAVSILGLLFANSIWIIFVITLFLGLGFHGFRPVRDSYLVDILPSSLGSGSLGIVRTGMTLVGAVSPVALGFISDISGFTYAFGLLVVTLSIGAVLLAVLRW